MGERTIYTIGRQFGSGGRQVGKALAERLGIPYYDKELLAMAAKDSGFSEELFHSADEKPASSLLYSLVMGNYPMSSGTLGFNEMPLNDQLFLIQSNTIRKVAKKGSCIIIGRCADYILKGNPSRANFYNYYSDQKWGMCRTYSLSLDSSLLGIEGCVDEIIRFTELADKNKNHCI